jgi:hypothetical protein
MTYAILLDYNQQQVSSDEYAVTYSGSLQACRAQTNNDGGFETWKKKYFTEISSEPKSLTNGTGHPDVGRIAGLEQVGLAKRYALPIAAGFAAGLAVAAALGKRLWRK